MSFVIFQKRLQQQQKKKKRKKTMNEIIEKVNTTKDLSNILEIMHTNRRKKKTSFFFSF